MEATEYEFRIFAENETGFSRPRRTPMGIKTKLSGEFKLAALLCCLLTASCDATSGLACWTASTVTAFS